MGPNKVADAMDEARFGKALPQSSSVAISAFSYWQCKEYGGQEHGPDLGDMSDQVLDVESWTLGQSPESAEHEDEWEKFLQFWRMRLAPPLQLRLTSTRGGQKLRFAQQARGSCCYRDNDQLECTSEVEGGNRFCKAHANLCKFTNQGYVCGAEVAADGGRNYCSVHDCDVPGCCNQRWTPGTKSTKCKTCNHDLKCSKEGCFNLRCFLGSLLCPGCKPKRQRTSLGGDSVSDSDSSTTGKAARNEQ
jgi:hypothetical protein